MLALLIQSPDYVWDFAWGLGPHPLWNSYFFFMYKHYLERQMKGPCWPTDCILSKPTYKSVFVPMMTSFLDCWGWLRRKPEGTGTWWKWHGESPYVSLFTQAYLEMFYQLPRSGYRSERRNTTSVIVEKLKEMQRFFGLNETGKPDEKTLEMMRKPRCGVPDNGGFMVTPGNPKWERTNLTYRWDSELQSSLRVFMSMWCARHCCKMHGTQDTVSSPWGDQGLVSEARRERAKTSQAVLTPKPDVFVLLLQRPKGWWQRQAVPVWTPLRPWQRLTHYPPCIPMRTISGIPWSAEYWAEGSMCI